MKSLESLPVEILYRILDFVDGETILFSLRPVCKQFRAITNTYDRHDLDTSSYSRAQMYFIGTLVPPEGVISLTLGEIDNLPGRIDHFTRLRSLTLRNIIDKVLLTLCQYALRACSLTSLSIKFLGTESVKTLDSFVSPIKPRALRRVDIDNTVSVMDKIKWPMSSALQFLEMDDCTLTQFCVILDHSPNLRTIVLRNGIQIDSNQPMLMSYPQLTSLSLCNLSARSCLWLELLFSLTPSLTYLKMIAFQTCHSLFNGFAWKILITTHLTHLNVFEFFFTLAKTHSRVSHEQRSSYARYFIKRFRKAFWVKTKRWQVGCIYDVSMQSIMLYSLPICLTSFSYRCRSIGEYSSDSNIPQFNTEDYLQVSESYNSEQH